LRRISGPVGELLKESSVLCSYIVTEGMGNCLTLNWIRPFMGVLSKCARDI